MAEDRKIIGGYRPQGDGSKPPTFVPLQPSSVQAPARITKIRHSLAFVLGGHDGAAMSVEVTCDRALMQADLRKISQALLERADWMDSLPKAREAGDEAP